MLSLYIIVSFFMFFCVRLSHINKDYLLTYLLYCRLYNVDTVYLAYGPLGVTVGH